MAEVSKRTFVWDMEDLATEKMRAAKSEIKETIDYIDKMVSASRTMSGGFGQSTNEMKSDISNVKNSINDLKNSSNDKIKISAEDNTKQTVNSVKQEIDDIKKQSNEIRIGAVDDTESTFRKVKSEATSFSHEKANINVDAHDQTGSVFDKIKSESNSLTSKRNTLSFNGKDEVSPMMNNIGNEADKTKVKLSGMFGSILSANLATNAITSLGSALKETVSSGYESAEAATETAEKWKNMGASSTDIATLGASVKSLKENTNLSGTAVSNLTTKFYDMTNNAKQTSQLTEGVGSLADKLKLSGSQADSFSSSISKVYSSGDLTQSVLARLEKQAPGLGTALQQASGMSKNAFDSAVAAGKISSTQFSSILAKASSDYSENSKEFDSSSQGAMKNIKQSWADTKQALMTPLVNMSATGLSELSKSLQTPAMKSAITNLGEGIADLGKKLTDLIGYIANHQKDISSIIGDVLQIVKLFGMGIWNTFKGALTDIADAFNKISGNASKNSNPLKSVSTFLGDIAKHKTAIEDIGGAFLTWLTIEKSVSGIKKVASTFSDVYGGAKNAIGAVKDFMTNEKLVTAATKVWSAAQKALDIVMNANPISLIVIAIVALAAAFYEAYEHIKPFRDAVNGLCKLISSGFSAGIKAATKLLTGWAKDISSWWSGLTKSTSKWVSSHWDSTKKGFSNGVKAVNKTFSSWGSDISNWWSKTNKSTSKWVKNTWDDTKSKYNNMKNDVGNILGNFEKTNEKGWQLIQKGTAKYAQDIWSGTKNVYGNLKNDVGNILTNTFNISKSTWTNLKTNTGLLTGALSDLVHGNFSGMEKDLGKIWNNISSSYSNMWNGFKDIASNVFVTIKSVVKGGINDVIGFLNGGINGLDDVIHFFGGSKKAVSDIPKLAKGTNGKIMKATPAIVNDQPGSVYREAIIRSSGHVEIPQGRDVLRYLDVGDAVVPAQATKDIYGDLPHFASGTSDWFSKMLSGAEGIGSSIVSDVSNAVDGLADAIKNPAKVLEKIFDGISNTGQGVFNDMAKYSGNFLAKSATSWFTKQLKELEDSFGNAANPSGSGVTRWEPIIKEIAAKMDVDLSDSGMNAILKRIKQESNGDPTIRNNWDSNAKAGHPSVGLLQYIQSTLSAWVPKGVSAVLTNGAAQISAMFNDSNWLKDISVSGGWGPTGHRRFDNGGWITSPETVDVAEKNAEVIINPTKPNALNLASEAIAAIQNKQPSLMNSISSSDTDNLMLSIAEKILEYLATIAENTGSSISLKDLSSQLDNISKKELSTIIRNN